MEDFNQLRYFFPLTLPNLLPLPNFLPLPTSYPSNNTLIVMISFWILVVEMIDSSWLNNDSESAHFC